MTKSLAIVLVIGGFATACSKPPAGPEELKRAEISPTAAPETSNAPLDACSVLSPAELAQIFGHAAKDEPKKLDSAEGGFHVSQCRVMLQNDAGILDIRIVQKGVGPEARDPREGWKESFAREKVEQARAEAHRAKWIPEEVRGVGEAAFWRGDNKEGSLYALKGNAYVRISLSNGEDKNAKLRKCSALAAAVLKHL